MFGLASGTPPPASNRPPASEVARVEGALTHIIVSSTSSDGLNVFVNGQPITTGEVESVTLEIIAPDANNQNGSVTAVLSRYVTGSDGVRGEKPTSLFPGTVEVMARGRRLTVTCLKEGSFDGLWLGLGLRADGTSSELSGVRSLRLAVAPRLLDAKLVWSDDGTTEDLLPE